MPSVSNGYLDIIVSLYGPPTYNLFPDEHITPETCYVVLPMQTQPGSAVFM